MRNDARPIGENAPRDDAGRQEQAVERSPAGRSRPGSSVDDEHAASSNTQHADGLSGGSPAGGPRQTPERMRTEERERDPGKPFVTAADPADEDRNVTHSAATGKP
jgi:hypothetical protein